MKRMFTAVLLAFLFAAHLSAQDDVMKKIYQLYRDKEYGESLKLVEKHILEEGETDRLLEAKYYIFKATDQDDKVKEVAKKRLVLIDKIIEEKGEDARSLSTKFALLKELGRMDEALKTAIATCCARFRCPRLYSALFWQRSVAGLNPIATSF